MEKKNQNEFIYLCFFHILLVATQKNLTKMQEKNFNWSDKEN